MSKIVPVSLLKAGDKFAFVNGPASGSASPLNQESKTILVVTRPPAVNLAANTCFFRYQQLATLDTGPNSRESNDSWNGAPDTQVRLVTGETAGAIQAAGVPAAAATNNKPVVQSTANGPRGVEKSVVEASAPATPKTEAESEAAPRAKSAKTRIIKTAKLKEAKPQDAAPAKRAAGKTASARVSVEKPVSDEKRAAVVKRAAIAPISERAAAEKSEPRQGIAIFPSLTKAVPSKSTTKKVTIEPAAAKKIPAKKSAAAKASSKKAAKKTARKK